jgi:tape measure domain-containing protein
MAEEKLVYEIVVDDTGATKSFKKIEGAVDGVDKKFQGASKRSKGFGQTIGSLGKMAAGLGLALGAQQVLAFGKSFVQAGADLEQTRIAFGTLFGSMAAGNAQLDKFIEFANVTPFVTKEVVTAGKALATAGLEGNELMSVLTNVGDIASATGANFTGLGDVVSKALNKGKIQGEVLNQFLERSIPITEALGSVMGVSADSIFDLGAKGEITGEHLKAAMDKITTGFKKSNGQIVKWGGMMEKQSKTLTGLFSTLTGKWDTFVSKVAEGNQGALKGLVQNLITIVDILPKVDFTPIFQPFEMWGDIMMQVFEGFSDLFSLIGGDGFSALSKFQFAVDAIGIAFKVILGPMLIIVNLMTTIVKVVTNAITQFGKLTDVVFALGNAFVALSTFDPKQIGDAFSKIKSTAGTAFSDIAGKEFGRFGGNVADLFSMRKEKTKGKSTAFDMFKTTMPTAVTKLATGTANGGSTNAIAGTTGKRSNDLKQSKGKATQVNIQNVLGTLTINVQNSVKEAYPQIKREVEKLLVESAGILTQQ